MWADREVPVQILTARENSSTIFQAIELWKAKKKKNNHDNRDAAILTQSLRVYGKNVNEGVSTFGYRMIGKRVHSHSYREVVEIV